MEERKLEKGGIYELPVKSIRFADRRSFYIVEAEGREHAIGMFPFQKNDPQPETISCLIKDIHEGIPVIIQNFAPLLQRFYTEGEIYTFWVRRDFTQLPNGYYEVADWNGFYFRLLYYGNAKLHIRQRVECRVRSLRDYKLCLELVQRNVENKGLPFLTHEEILEEVGAPESISRWIRKKFLELPVFKEATNLYLSDNGEWILSAVTCLEKQLEKWVRTGNRHNGLLIELYQKVCLYLLEDSAFLADCPEQERLSYQQLFSEAAQRAEDYIEALKLVQSQSHIQYITTLQSKMEKSGYLYQSERKMRVLRCIFTIEQGLMMEKMPLFLDIIKQGNKDNWKVEPFRSSFVQLLIQFIQENRSDIDHLANIDNQEGRHCLEQMITALAILLLLTTDKDDFDRQMSRSMLYRYLTFLKCSDTEVLLEKAFASLSDTTRKDLEFGWREVEDLTLLGIRLSNPMIGEKSEGTHIMQSFVGKQGQLRIINGNIQLLPLGESQKLRSALPDWLLQWHGMEVLLPDPITQEITRETSEVAAFQKMWKEVEYSLFNSKEEAPSSWEVHKLKPEVGDEVTIRVLRQDMMYPDYFYCQIEDDTYEGTGKLNVRNIVRYKPHADISMFCNDEGKPFLLKAKVQNVLTDGRYNFGLQDLIGMFVYQNVAVGSTVQCMVVERMHNNHFCVSEFGYPVLVPEVNGGPELKPGDYIEAEVNYIRPNGTVYADFMRQIVEGFSMDEAFSNLIYNYADEQVYEPADGKEEEQVTEVMMERPYVNELMYIIDRVAMINKDYLKTYNYLGVARVIAILLGRENMTKYYTERMKLLQMLQQFAINGQVDSDKLKEQGRINGDMLKNYPLLKNRLSELETVSCIDHPEQNAFLWRMSEEAMDVRLSNVAKLVLSYNLLDGFDMYEQKTVIRQKINDILNITVHYEAPQYFGREDQHAEFKTSLVYPANTMRADLPKQTLEIMKVICGFLNAEGGTLYMGVNNEGVACGLENDLEYFGGSLDKFDLHLRNNIVIYMGTDANARVTVSYPSTGKRLVYALTIKPSPRPVQCDGVYYLRQGSSTWPLLDEEEIKAFVERRKEEWSALESKAEQPGTEVSAAPEPGNVPEVAKQPEVEEPEAGTLQNIVSKVRDYSTILTSQIRPNAIHSWEEGYGEDTIGYLHLLTDNRYLISDSESWRSDILLSLAIHENEEDGYLVIVYESGRIVRVPVGELLDKTRDTEYKRYSDDTPFFISLAQKDEALLTVVADVQDRPSYRMDDVQNLKEGTMKTKGECLSNVEINGVLQCDIIPAAKKSVFKRIHNMRNTNIGINLTVMYGGDELQALEKMGITL